MFLNKNMMNENCFEINLVIILIMLDVSSVTFLHYEMLMHELFLVLGPTKYLVQIQS